MKTHIFIFLLSFISLYASDVDYWLDFETGHRVDNLVWSIGYNDRQPDILSELTWDSVETYYGKVSLYGESGPYKTLVYYLRSKESEKGTNQDSDYLLSGRQAEFSRSNNKTKGSYFVDYGIRFGENYIFSKNADLTLWIGYEVNQQFFRMNDAYQTIPHTGPFDNLNSTYDVEWKGYLVGFEHLYRFGDFSLNSNVNLHFFMEYEAVADWNLRTDFQHPVSYRHTADKTKGLSYNFDLEYEYYSDMRFYLTYGGYKFRAEDGTDTTYFSNGTEGTIPLKDVTWENQNIGFGIKIEL